MLPLISKYKQKIYKPLNIVFVMKIGRKIQYLVWSIRNNYNSDAVKPIEPVAETDPQRRYEPPIMTKVDLDSGPDGNVILGKSLDEVV